MVFLHVKRDKEVQFYIEVPAVTLVGKVATQAAEMHNLIRRIQRICAEGARFAHQVLQSSEPTPEQERADSDDESTDAPGGTATPQRQEAIAESVAVPALEGRPVSEPPAQDAGDDSAAVTAAAAALDGANLGADSQQLAMRVAQQPASSAHTVSATADSCCGRNAEGPDSVGASGTHSAQSSAAEATGAAAKDVGSRVADASETAATLPAVSEADGQFEMLCRALLAASQLIVTERAAQRQLLTAEELRAVISAIQAAADDACLALATGGDVFRKCLAEEAAPYEAIHADILPDTAVLWVANRKLDNGKTLAAEVGSNNKTRVVVTVQHAKEPAPPRSTDPPAEEYDQMLAFYYQWQEKDKSFKHVMQRLEADMDLGYFNSPWADPRSLKRGLSGVGGVTMPKHGPRGFN